MLCPDSGLIVLHQLAGGHGNVCPAGHHPRADAHALREHHRALGGALPQGTGEVPVGQGQDVGQGNDVGGVAVVDDTVCAIGGGLADAMVHKVAEELTGRLCAVLQAPDNAPAVALVVDFHDADAVNRVRLHVAEKFAGAGGDEILPCQIIRLHAHVHPRPGLLVKEGAALRHFLFLHAVGQVAAVALVPALQPAIVAHPHKAFYNLNIQNTHLQKPLSFKCACSARSVRISLLPQTMHRPPAHRSGGSIRPRPRQRAGSSAPPAAPSAR